MSKGEGISFFPRETLIQERDFVFDLLGFNDIPSPFVVKVWCFFEIAIFAVLFPSSPISAPHCNVLLLIEIDL